MNPQFMKSKVVGSFVLAMLWHSGYFCQTAWSQDENTVPDYFIRIDSGGNLPQKIVQAANRFKKENSGDRFWVGYRFEPREEIRFHDICIHDDGGISISRGGPETVLWAEDDLKTHALYALSQLGDEEATKKLSAQEREFIKSNCQDWGVFYLLDSESLSVDRIKLIHFRSRKTFKDVPVFWLGEQETNNSFEYLAGIIQNKGYSERVIEPAIFVLSLHDHPQTIRFLTDIAAGDRSVEIRKSAAFWLGQIPGEESFAALMSLFNDEQNRDMKEQFVFAISQHASEKVIDQLMKIAKNDPDFDIREKAIFWLGQRDDEKSLDVLEEMLHSTRNEELGEKIIFSISQHKSDRAASILIDAAKKNSNPELRKKAIFWLGQMASMKTLEALGDIAESDDETEIKTNAVFAISQHGDQERAVELLIDIAKHNKNPEVRKKAMFWLGQTGDARAIEFFKQVLAE
jgi:hypothetical protein